MARNSRKPVFGARVADPSNTLRHRVPDGIKALYPPANPNTELEELHRRLAALEGQLGRLKAEKVRLTQKADEIRTENGWLVRRLSRRARAILSLLLTIEIKAFYCMSISFLWDNAWWANAAQAVTGVAIGGYLIWPNARILGQNLLHLSRATADLSRGRVDIR